MIERNALPYPPANLKSNDVPLFIVFGFDDNLVSGLQKPSLNDGMRFITDLFSRKRNPGENNVQTYDNSDCHFSFYVNCHYLQHKAYEDAGLLIAGWKDAISRGHELGSHSYHHKHGSKYSEKEWFNDITLNNVCLTDRVIDSGRIAGFRAPYLHYNDNLFHALTKSKFAYDCSIEDGYQVDIDGKNFLWPYTLHNGSEGDRYSDWREITPVTSHPGIWEIPCYPYIVPPDELAAHYDIAPGLRKKIADAVDYFHFESGKMTSFDWNLFFEFHLTKKETLATLKYSLDQRIAGNRCPFTFGAHSEIYSHNFQKAKNITVQERKEVLEEFIDYALSFPFVRLVSAIELLTWLENPVALTETVDRKISV